MYAIPKAPSQNQLQSVVAFYNRGELDAALLAAEALAQEYPSIAMLQNLLGVINSKKGAQEQAIRHFKRAVELNPVFPDAYNNLGVALRSLGRREQAIQNYTRAIAIKPDYADAYFNLANTFRDLDRREEAVQNYKKALQIAPNHLGARNNLGVILNKLERYEEAIENFEIVLSANPNFLDAYNNMGLALKALGREEEAMQSFETAIEKNPGYAEAHYNLGSYLFDLGRKDEARSRYEKALKINPAFAEAYRSMGAVKKYEIGDPQISQMQTMFERYDLSDDDRMQLCYALGKVSEDIGDREKAFEYYSNGNALRKKFLGYDPQVEREMFRKIKTAFKHASPSLAITDRNSDRYRNTPIFIVGMPRSGTSLTEQILASHSKIYGAGELMTLGKAIHSIWSGKTIDESHLHAIRNVYLADLEKRAGDEPFVTDKMHLNYRWIGFICLAFPGAKIVHIKRRSIASCWSIFKYYFSDLGNGFAYDLDDLAEYYSSYMDLMRFWEERFPGAIYNFSYERLTEDQEEETRKLLAYIGFDLEQSCIDFHETKRAVATISSMQVRRKLYKGSSEEWRKYEQFLGPLIETLGTE
jgi:tetratricopeptide (TPR) repeat protein